MARKRTDRFFRFADLTRHAPSHRNSAAAFAPLVCRDRNVALDPSSIPVAKVELISDRPLPIDKKSLFDTVPFPTPLWLRSGFEARQLNKGEKSTAKEP